MFSLYATKNLMTGEGGFATTDDDALADRIRLYRNHGMHVRYYHDSLGTNFKPTDLAAALGLAQLPRLDERTARRRRNAARLTAGLAGYLTPGVPEGREHVWHQYTMRFPGERQRVIDGLTERGVGTLIYYPVPTHRQAYLQAFMPGAADLPLPVTDRLSEEVLSIPVRPNLTDEELDHVIEAVREVATPVGATDRRMSPARLRVGLAGLGTMGRNHLRNLAARDDVTLVAVADPAPDPPAARAVGRAGRARLRRPAGDARRGAPRRGHRGRADDPPPRGGAGRHRARRWRCSSRSRWPARWTRRATSCVPRTRRRRPPGRPHRAVQPGRAGARAAPR